MDPAQEELFIVRQDSPLNAEPPTSALAEFPITPEQLVYHRNHSDVPAHDGTLVVGAEDPAAPADPPPADPTDPHPPPRRVLPDITQATTFTIDDLERRFPKARVEAVLQCAGLRRAEMGATGREVKGVPWGAGVVANCYWGGVRLRDVLLEVFPGLEREANGANRTDEHAHVCFTARGAKCEDDAYYGASIPLSKALDPEGDVLVAWEMNDDDIPPVHGGPLRLVVPGYLGARWVKWLDGIYLSNRESPNYYQARDYKVLPEEVEDKKQAAPWWDKVPSMTSMPLNSVIASVTKVEDDGIPAGHLRLRVKGYALPALGVPVDEVQISVDDETHKVDEEGRVPDNEALAGKLAVNGKLAEHGEKLAAAGKLVKTRNIQQLPLPEGLDVDAHRVWEDARITYQGGRWAWTLWEGEVVARARKGKIIVRSRALSRTGEAQPESGKWNLRGVAWNGWSVGEYEVDA
ncbi:molybdopterin binding oxidoreductase [Schizophyllum commune H4-8]|uniref:molybdopterin binding oxidoreductase n=1 Tax=Schizophyllum commune (strain H4-8 / FGSC 9210) TaxID=578458 RepID=UPI0021607814|nr:molybdopterin binding oxidoreductase [Schizophyllum commune H4-8]KAI5892268.1 molybdopterin binding oxidoreductase [Schizophyllum commune H4-8]